MIYLEHRPAPPLSLFVQTLWYTCGYNAEHRRERILPNGSVQLIVSLSRDYIVDCGRGPGISDSRLAPALVAGVHTEFMIVDTGDLDEMIGVQFWPGGTRPFFEIPADEFSNTHVELEAVWGRDAAGLHDALQTAPTAQIKFRALEESLLAKLRERSNLHPAVCYALKRFRSVGGDQRVADVTSELGLSPRRFAQVFREHVGVTPKVYCRILRFQQAVQQMSFGHDVNWTEVALSCGYFDQSHFANDFRSFSGITPSDYSGNRSPQWKNHLRID